MLKPVSASLAASIVGCGLIAFTGDASAACRAGDCGGTLPPTYVYHDRQVYRNVTQYRDVWRTRYVPRVHPIVHVTRVQPIINVQDVTRVHYRTIPVDYAVHYRATQLLPAQTTVTPSYAEYYDYSCSCYW